MNSVNWDRLVSHTRKSAAVMTRQFDQSFPELEPLQRTAPAESPIEEAYKAMRTSRRHEINSRVTILPADSSRSGEKAWEGMTVDVSNGGCQILGSSPLPCGDYFSIHFVTAEIDLPPQLSRCLRVRLIDDSTFEIGLRFEHPVQIDAAVRSE